VYGFLLDPRIVVDGHEERDGERLRVELCGGSAFLIETLQERFEADLDG
jgi:hypothetical protein